MALTTVSKIRNSAAHLKTGPVFDLSSAPEVDWVRAAFGHLKLVEKDFDDWADLYKRLDLNEPRMRFDFTVVQLGARIYAKRTLLVEGNSTT